MLKYRYNNPVLLTYTFISQVITSSDYIKFTIMSKL
jgi:hypothetical protein